MDYEQRKEYLRKRLMRLHKLLKYANKESFEKLADSLGWALDEIQTEVIPRFSSVSTVEDNTVDKQWRDHCAWSVPTYGEILRVHMDYDVAFLDVYGRKSTTPRELSTDGLLLIEDVYRRHPWISEEAAQGIGESLTSHLERFDSLIKPYRRSLGPACAAFWELGDRIHKLSHDFLFIFQFQER